MKKEFNFGFFACLAVALWFGAFGLLTIFQPAQAQQNTNSAQRPRQTVTPTPTPPKPGVSPKIEDDPDVFKVESDLVNLSVRVVDRNGRIVADVRDDEFKVFENGVEQKVEFVSRTDVPINYGLVVDNSGSLRFQIEKVIDAGKIIIGANKPADEAFVIRFVGSQQIEELQPFTNDQAKLIDALDSMHIDGGATAIIDAVMLAAEKASEYEKEKRREEKTRRAIVLITDGEDRSSYYKEEDLFRALREADVQIYTIGFVNELSKEGGFIKGSEQKKAIKFLERLASDTGGKAYFPNSVTELPDIARQINNELRTQYLVSYAPSNNDRDGTFRSIKVTIADDAKRGKRIPLTKTGRTAPKN